MTNSTENSIEKTAKTKMQVVLDDLEEAKRINKDLREQLKKKNRIIKKFQENSKKGREK